MVNALLMQVKSLWALRQGDHYTIKLYVCYIPFTMVIPVMNPASVVHDRPRV